MPVPRRLSVDRARRIALAAQGFCDPRPPGRVDVRHFRRVLSRVGVVQLDSVNVVARAHYLPFLARLGPYPTEALDAWLWGSGEVCEYWAHEASLIPVGDWPLFRHRMAGGWHWESVERIGTDHPEYTEEVYEEVRRRGPLVAGDLAEPRSRPGSWWHRSDAKLALEHLFLTGRVTTTARPNFQRVYDLTERVLPAAALDAPAPDTEEAQRRLLLRAARHHGIGAAADLADYYRIRVPAARPLLAHLAAEGQLIEVEVEGWKDPAYLHPEATTPRRVQARALLAPFDPVVWFRPRAERLFGFRYRIEIYVPEPKRVHGYYVLPFLLGDQLVARVDVKADRQRRRLLARGAFAEEGVDPTRVATELAAALEELAAWLGLEDVEVGRRGDLAPVLRRVAG